MTESCAIVQYLVGRYGPTPLAVAADEPDYGAYLNWLHRADATLTFPLALVFRYRDLEAPERRSPQVAEDYRRWFLGRLRSVEAATAEREYLCADRFTAADLCAAYAIYFADRLGLEEAFTPNVAGLVGAGDRTARLCQGGRPCRHQRAAAAAGKRRWSRAGPGAPGARAERSVGGSGVAG